MPTRYTLELEGLKGVVTNETFTEVSQREEAKKTVKKALEERYLSGKNRWFFTPLRKFGCALVMIGGNADRENRVLNSGRRCGTGCDFTRHRGVCICFPVGAQQKCS